MSLSYVFIAPIWIYSNIMQKVIIMSIIVWVDIELFHRTEMDSPQKW